MSESTLTKGRRASDKKTVEGLLIAISDQGVGIPDDELELIFDKFEQSTKTRTQAGETGLGLSICKNIIDEHRGTIHAENNQDGGATFTFVLPKQINKRSAA
ncbi:MAG: sensor histidine kinase [Gammaproteobacteria bacterium]